MTYNANRTSNIETPSDAPGKVVVEAILSGHGDCEFEPTAHFWEVNGVVYNVTFFGAGTQYVGACSVRTSTIRVDGVPLSFALAVPLRATPSPRHFRPPPPHTIG